MSEHEEAVGGESRPLRERPPETVVVRHDEHATVEKGWRGIGFLRARKRTETVTVREQLPIDFEQLVQERVAVGEGDSGEIETLADGSISIPLYEEELVVTKRTVLRERSSSAKRSPLGSSELKRICVARASRSTQTTESN